MRVSVHNGKQLNPNRLGIIMVIRLYRLVLFIAWFSLLIWVALELDKMQVLKFLFR